MTPIHPTAIIEKGAEIGAGTSIGPYCFVGANVRMGCNNVLQSHVVLDGNLTMGDHNEVFPFACLGKKSQDLKFKDGMVAGVKIGSHNVFREYVTVNAASRDGGDTVVGSHNTILCYSHVAHDCELGNHIIISGHVALAGHVHVHDHAIINGMTGVVQFVNVGCYAFVGALNKVIKDILPYCIADGSPSVVRAINKIGLERNGIPAERIRILHQAFTTMMRSGLTMEDACLQLHEQHGNVPEVQEMIRFARASRLGLARPHGSRHHGE